jgi:hypothetical protein
MGPKLRLSTRIYWGVFAAMVAAAAMATIRTPADHLPALTQLPPLKPLGLPARLEGPLPPLGLFALPIVVVLFWIVILIPMRFWRGPPSAIENKRKWAGVFIGAFALIMGAWQATLIAATFGLLGASPVSFDQHAEPIRRLMVSAAGLVLVFGGNRLAKLMAFSKSNEPAPSQQQAVRRFSGLVLVIWGAVIAASALILPLDSLKISAVVSAAAVLLLFAARQALGRLAERRSA